MKCPIRTDMSQNDFLLPANEYKSVVLICLIQVGFAQTTDRLPCVDKKFSVVAHIFKDSLGNTRILKIWDHNDVWGNSAYGTRYYCYGETFKVVLFRIPGGILQSS